MKSNYLKDFIKEIQYKNRNPRDLKALKLLDDKSTNPEITIEPNQYLYRARIVDNEKGINKERNFYGYDAQGSFVTRTEFTRDGRANYRYIPYLYCATHPYIAMAEVRPRIGSKVSIAKIKVKETLTLLDFTIKNKPSKMTDAKKNLFDSLSELFSKPVTKDDDILDYIPTQFIAEYAKYIEYDGIVFSSSVTPEYKNKYSDRYNVVVFNYDKCEAIKSNIVKVKYAYMECEQIDDDEIKLNMKCDPEEELSKI